MNDREYDAEMMYRAVWPNLDPDDETDGSFEKAIDLIPRAVKRRFGFGVRSLDDIEADDAERQRLYAYTDFPRLRTKGRPDHADPD